MAGIKLKTDGKQYNQLIEKREEQLAHLATLEEHEEQADKAYSHAFQRYMTVAAADPQLAERLSDARMAYKKYRQATARCGEFANEVASTFIAIVVELIHDNIDMLDGMDIDGDQVFFALNEALPDGIFVDTDMGELNAALHVYGGSKDTRARMALQQFKHETHIPCCGKQNHFIDKERFIAYYENEQYGNFAQ